MLISHASKVMIKIFQARLQQYVNQKLSDVQAGFRKGRGTRDQIANICWIIEKAREFQKKHLFLLYWLCQSLWLIGKDFDAGRDWRQEKKGMTEDEIAGWHHWLDRRESEWTPGVVWITISCGKFWERWEYQTTWPATWETYMQLRKQQLELDME